MNELKKITKERFKNHLHYGKWYYIIAILAVVLLVNLAYTVTEPRFPKENTISIIMYVGNGNEDMELKWEKEMLALLGDDQREVDLILTIPTDISTQSVVIARIAANEDDIIAIDKQTMNTLALQDAFMPLDEMTDMHNIYDMYPDIDWTQYEMISEKQEDKQKHIYYIPIHMVDKFSQLEINTDVICIGILANGVNKESALSCLEYMVKSE